MLTIADVDDVLSTFAIGRQHARTVTLADQTSVKQRDFNDLEEARRLLEAITPRQRSVMNRVLEHRTSKEIARDLSIAPNTVDQRLNAVRDKLQTRDRAETARIYAQLLSTCGESTCGFPVVDFPSALLQSGNQEAVISPVFMLNDASAIPSGPMHLEEWESLGMTRDLGARGFDSKLGRLGIIVAIAIGVAIVVATILSVMNALNALI